MSERPITERIADLGNDVHTGEFCLVAARERGISISQQAHIAAYCSLNAEEKITLSGLTGLSPRVSICTANADYTIATTRPAS